MTNKISLIAGRSHPQLASRLAIRLNAKLLTAQITNFDDSETSVQVTNLTTNHTIIVQSICSPVNDHLMELLLLSDAAKRAGAQRITAIIPYLGYGRQDRRVFNHGPVPASLVARMLELAGINHLVTIDLHSPVLEGLFNIPVTHLSLVETFAQYITFDQDIVIVSPDLGGIDRARRLSILLNRPLAILAKHRQADHSCSMQEVIGRVEGKRCLIVDDIVDSAETVCQAATLLTAQGAREVTCFISHGVLSGSAITRLDDSLINQIYISDSIAQATLPTKFCVIGVDQLIADHFPY